MRYAVARFQREQRDTAYRIYISDVLRTLTQATASIGGLEYQSKRFADIVYPDDHQGEDDRTGEEIISDLRQKLEVN